MSGAMGTCDRAGGNPPWLDANLTFFRACSSDSTFDCVEGGLGLASASMGLADAQSGEPYLWVSNSTGSRMLLHSRRDPREEALRQVRHWLAGSECAGQGAVVVLGAAGLYHVEAFAAEVPADRDIIVVEPDSRIMALALRCRDLAELARRSDRIHFAVADNCDELCREYRQILTRQPKAIVSFFVHPASRRLDSDGYSQLHSRLAAETKSELMGRGTSAHLSMEWQYRAIRNLPYVANALRIDAFRGVLEGIPAIMVAAGPSLNQALPLIRELRSRTAVFCVGTAYRPLLKAGIEPDFVVTIDSSEKTWCQFEGTTSGNACLIAGPIAYTPILELFGERLVACSCAAVPEFVRWVESFSAAPAELAVGGTVSVTAIDAAAFMGCPLIICVGLDLALGKDGTTHAKNSMYDGYRMPEAQLVTVPGNTGEPVVTTRQFAQYVEMLGSYLWEARGRYGCRVVNPSATGARIANADTITLADVSGLIGTEPADVSIRIDRAMAPGDRGDAAAAAEACDAAAEELAEVGRRSADAERICARLMEKTRPESQAQLLDELAQIDGWIKDGTPAMKLVDGTIRAVCMHFATGTLPAGETTEGESMAQAMEWSANLYGHINAAAISLEELLQQTGKRIRGGSIAGIGEP